MKTVTAFTIFLSAFLVLITLPVSAKPVIIAKDGQIVMNQDYYRNVDEAVAEDFTRVLEKITGHVNFSSRRHRRSIIAGTKDIEAFKGRYDHLTGEDTFQIAVKGGDIHLVGATPQAVNHAIYTFLHDLGCRWYMPGEIGEVIPEQPDLVWDGQPRIETPDFVFREIWWAYGGPPETADDFRWWKLRNRASGRVVSHGHNLTNTVPPGQYLEDHPEYYALVDGKRIPTQLCTSNPEVIRLSIEHINAHFDTYPELMSYSLCPDDNMEFCECAGCLALDNKEGPTVVWQDHPNITDRLQVYLNAVAQGVQEQHPGKMVTTYAYVNYSIPPQREPVDPHVAVVLTTSVYCSGHSIGDPHCDSRMEMKRDLAGWAKACKNTFIYEYDPTPFNAELPWPMYGTHARSLPVYKAMGIQGFSYESHNSWATLFPNHYVSARMMWDADQDYDALMDDICTGFYGKGGAAMRQFYDRMDEAIRRFPEKIEWGQKAYPEIFTPEVVTQCRAYIVEAKAAAQDPAAQARLDMVSKGYAYFELYLHCRNAAKGDMPFKEYKVIRDSCDALVDELYAENKDFILAEVAKDYLGRELGQVVSEHYAAEMGLQNQWMLMGPFDNAGRNGHEAVLPPERAIDLSQSYPGLNGETLHWKTFEGQSWQGQLDLITLIGPYEWATAYAACRITSPKKQEVFCRVGSNDTVKVFMNGDVVWDNPIYAGRILTMDDDIFPVTLPEGTSTLLVKISNMGGNWGFCLRFTDKDGNAIEGLESSIEF